MLITALLLAGLALGQPPAEKPPQEKPAATPAPKATPPPTAAPAQPPAAPRPPAVRPSITVMVTDRSGRVLPDVSVKATGAMEREGKTDPEGTILLRNVSPGTYRLRFESPTTITFEREVTVAAGRPLKTTVELSAAPPPPPPPKPQPAPEAPAPGPPPAATPPPSGPPSSVDVINFFEKNYVGGAPAKNSPIGCTGSATATLIQLRDPLAQHSHADADELLYVVAGEGIQRIGQMDTTLTAGTFAVVPRGTPHTISRRGNRPVVFISILTGPPCMPSGK